MQSFRHIDDQHPGMSLAHPGNYESPNEAYNMYMIRSFFVNLVILIFLPACFWAIYPKRKFTNFFMLVSIPAIALALVGALNEMNILSASSIQIFRYGIGVQLLWSVFIVWRVPNDQRSEYHSEELIKGAMESSIVDLRLHKERQAEGKAFSLDYDHLLFWLQFQLYHRTNLEPRTVKRVGQLCGGLAVVLAAIASRPYWPWAQERQPSVSLSLQILMVTFLFLGCLLVTLGVPAAKDGQAQNNKRQK